MMPRRRASRHAPRPPLFYGWWMVWLGGFLSSLNKTAVNRGFPVFVAPVRESFGASNAAVAFIFALARAQSGPTGLWAGWCLDRFGPRRVLWVGALMSGGGFLALGYTTSLWAFGVLYLLVVTVGTDLGFSYALSAVSSRRPTRCAAWRPTRSTSSSSSPRSTVPSSSWATPTAAR